MKRILSIFWVLALIAVASVGVAVTFSPESALAGKNNDNG